MISVKSGIDSSVSRYWDNEADERLLCAASGLGTGSNENELSDSSLAKKAAAVSSL